MRASWALLLIGCGASAPLTAAAPPPTWPVINITDVHTTAAAAATPVQSTLLFESAPTSVTATCGEEELAWTVDGSIARLDRSIQGCTVRAVKDDQTLDMVIEPAPAGPLTCTWEPPRCGSPVP